jgi:hypothetical protein
VYSGEYDVCDVTLSVYPHRAILKKYHGGNRTYDLWNASPPWPGIFFKLARCGYTLRVTSQTSKSNILIYRKYNKVLEKKFMISNELCNLIIKILVNTSTLTLCTVEVCNQMRCQETFWSRHQCYHSTDWSAALTVPSGHVVSHQIRTHPVRRVEDMLVSR